MGFRAQPDGFSVRPMARSGGASFPGGMSEGTEASSYRVKKPPFKSHLPVMQQLHTYLAHLDP